MEAKHRGLEWQNDRRRESASGPLSVMVCDMMLSESPLRGCVRFQRPGTPFHISIRMAHLECGASLAWASRDMISPNVCFCLVNISNDTRLQARDQ